MLRNWEYQKKSFPGKRWIERSKDIDWMETNNQSNWKKKFVSNTQFFFAILIDVPCTKESWLPAGNLPRAVAVVGFSRKYREIVANTKWRIVLSECHPITIVIINMAQAITVCSTVNKPHSFFLTKLTHGKPQNDDTQLRILI